MNTPHIGNNTHRTHTLGSNHPLIPVVESLMENGKDIETRYVAVPTDSKRDGDKLVLSSPSISSKNLPARLRVGKLMSVREAHTILLQACEAHENLSDKKLIERQTVIAFDHWYLDSNSHFELLLDLPSSLEKPVKSELTPTATFAAIFCNLIGSPQKTHHGTVEYQAVTKVGSGANKILRQAFEDDGTALTPRLFLEQLDKEIPQENVSNSDTSAEPSKANLPSPSVASTSAKSADKRKKKPTKKLIKSLAILLLSGGAIFAYIQYQGNNDAQSTQIYRDDDLPTVIAKLDNATRPEDIKRLYAQAVQIVGDHPDIRRFNPGIKSSITVPGMYPTISEAIQAASPGQEIHIKPGKYQEALQLKPNITLKGITDGVDEKVVISAPENHLGPILEGRSCKTVRLENIIIEKDKDSGYKVPSIELRNTTLLIKKCRILNSAGVGILLEGKSEQLSEFIGVIIDGSSSHGIHLLNGASAKVIGCEITNSDGDGLRVEGTDSFAAIVKSIFNENARGVLFTKQAFGEISDSGCSKNKHQGLAVFRSKLTKVKNFIATENDDTGLYISFGVVQKIIDSEFTKNKQHGIFIEDPQDIRVSKEEAIIELELDNVTSNKNSFSGLHFQIIEPEFEITKKEMTIPKLQISNSSTFNTNGKHGLELIGPLILIIEQTTVSENKEVGLKTAAEVKGEVRDSILQRNGNKAVLSDVKDHLLLEDITY